MCTRGTRSQGRPLRRRECFAGEVHLTRTEDTAGQSAAAATGKPKPTKHLISHIMRWKQTCRPDRVLREAHLDGAGPCTGVEHNLRVFQRGSVVLELTEARCSCHTRVLTPNPEL